MISVDGKQLVFTRPGSENPILRRDAVFAHRCPRCKDSLRPRGKSLENGRQTGI